MISTDEITTLVQQGGSVIGSDGEKLGKIGQLYLDDQTGEPAWVTVKTGLFGSKESFVPLASASAAGEDIRVPFGKEKVKDAPRIDDDGAISPQEEQELYRYYGLGSSGTTSGEEVFDQAATGTAEATGTPGRGRARGADEALAAGTGPTGTVGHDTSGPTTDDAMTRSEEQLEVGTRTQEAGRARLRKHVVTERQSATVPTSHEEVRVSREPITGGNSGAAHDGPSISEEEHEVVLHEEVPVVAKTTTPVERVRLDTETVREERTVSDDVRKEVIDLDEGTEATARRGRDDSER